jgi:Tfp pilus assembly protein PilN
MFYKSIGKFLCVDLRDRSIGLSLLENTLSELKIISTSTFPYHGPETDLTQIREFIVNCGNIKGVFVSVPDKWVIVRFIEVPPAKGKDALERMMRFEIERHIPFTVDEVVYDFEVVYKRERLLGIAMAALHKHRYESIITLFNNLHIRPDVIVPSSFAILNALDDTGQTYWQRILGLTEQRPEFRKGSGVNGIIYSHKGFAMMGIIKGGDYVDIRFLSKDIDASPVDAQEMVNYIRQTADSPEIGKVNRVYVICNESSMRDRYQGIGKALDLDVMYLNIPSGVDNLSDDARHESLVYRGLILAGTGYGLFNINFLPHKRILRYSSRIPVSTAVLGILVFLLLIGLFLSEYVRTRSYIKEIDARIEANREEVEKIERLKRTIDEFEKQTEIVNKMKDRDIALDLLAELAEKLPMDTWLSNLHFKSIDVGKGDKYGEIIIGGFSRSSSSLIPLLEESPYLERVEFVGSIKKTGDKEGFKIKADVIAPVEGRKKE